MSGFSGISYLIGAGSAFMAGFTLIMYEFRDRLEKNDGLVLTLWGFGLFLFFYGLNYVNSPVYLKYAYAFLAVTGGLLPFAIQRSTRLTPSLWTIAIIPFGILSAGFCFSSAFPQPEEIITGCVNVIGIRWALWVSLLTFLIPLTLTAFYALFQIYKTNSSFLRKKFMVLFIGLTLTGTGILLDTLGECVDPMLGHGWSGFAGFIFSFSLIGGFILDIYNKEESFREIEERYEKVQLVAIRDPLTGLYNRGYLIETLKQLIERAQRTGDSFGVMMIDLDDFKNINDTYGHQIGDYVLISVGKLLLRNSRAYDCPARYGGDEFMLIVVNIDKDDFVRLVERITQSLNTLTINVGGNVIKVGATVGAKYFYEKEGDIPKKIDDVISAVDNALYKGKKGMKGRAVLD